MTEAEVEKFLEFVQEKKPKYYALCLTAVTTGLRIGELPGLTWSDVDFNNRMIDVNKQWKILQNGKKGFGQLKTKSSGQLRTKSSKRKVPLPAKTVQILAREKQGAVLDINNRVFPFGDSARQSIARLFSALGYNYSMHDLRHTYATTLVAAGVDYKTVSELMGHGVNMTMKTYSHVNEDMRVRAAKTTEFFNKLNAFLTMGHGGGEAAKIRVF